MEERLGRRRPEDEGTGVVGISIRQSEFLPEVGDSERASENLPADVVRDESSELFGT